MLFLVSYWKSQMEVIGKILLHHWKWGKVSSTLLRIYSSGRESFRLGQSVDGESSGGSPLSQLPSPTVNSWFTMGPAEERTSSLQGMWTPIGLESTFRDWSLWGVGILHCSHPQCPRHWLLEGDVASWRVVNAGWLLCSHPQRYVMEASAQDAGNKGCVCREFKKQ